MDRLRSAWNEQGDPVADFVGIAHQVADWCHRINPSTDDGVSSQLTESGLEPTVSRNDGRDATLSPSGRYVMAEMPRVCLQRALILRRSARDKHCGVAVEEVW